MGPQEVHPEHAPPGGEGDQGRRDRHQRAADQGQRVPHLGEGQAAGEQGRLDHRTGEEDRQLCPAKPLLPFGCARR